MASNFLSYTLKIHDYLMELKRDLQEYGASQEIAAWLKELDLLDDRLENMRFQVAVVGEFKRGKTSFINALLRKQILPADVVPATATINRITYGNAPSSFICWKDERPVEEIAIDRLADYITKLTDSSAMTAQSIKEAVVRYPCRFCENNVDLIDTPGMNDDDAMNSVTIGQLSDIDLVIVTLDPNAPVSSTESHFIAQLVESEHICNIVFVVSKIDTVFAAQRERVLALIESRLKEHVQKVLLSRHEPEDDVMKKYRLIFSDPVIFPVSNTLALYSYEMGDRQSYEESGFRRLNDELLPIIIRTQHWASVMTPLAAISRISGEFVALLQKWEIQARWDEAFLSVKQSFGELIYGVQPQTEAIRQTSLNRVREQQKKNMDRTYLTLVQHIGRYSMQMQEGIQTVKALYRELRTRLQTEEENLYRQIWEEAFLPLYGNISANLKKLPEPAPTLLSQLEQELAYLTESETLATFTAEAEPFYWESPPLANYTLTGQSAADFAGNVVRTSLFPYYGRREKRLLDFVQSVMQEQSRKAETLLQKFTEATEQEWNGREHFPAVDEDTFAQKKQQLEQLAGECAKTREDYRKEWEVEE
jgi:GTPase SAR1 family protein